jgi:hypothetical protein
MERFGIFKSTDGGGNWSAANTGLTCGSDLWGVVALALDPTTLYAGTAGGVYKSTDGGTSWSPVNVGLPTSFPGNIVSALALDPTTPTTVYAGTEYSGVFTSTDGGGNWSAMNSGLTNLSVHALALDHATPTHLYAGTEGGVFVLDTATGGGGGGGGGGDDGGSLDCFIATAAYGSSFAPHVQTLRDFRDRHLLPHTAGRVVVGLYEAYSPPLAAFIAKYEGLKLLTRVALAPVVFAVVYPLGTGLFVLTAVAAAGCGLRIRHRSSERRP